MGVLNRLYQYLQEKFDDSRTSFDAPTDFIEVAPKRAFIRAELADRLRLIECALLLTQNQQDVFDLQTDRDEDIPFDEMEFILKNGITTRQYISNAKTCILDLDEISDGDSEEESRFLHTDSLSQTLLNMLYEQCAQVMLLTGDDAGDAAQWFIKEPRSFVRAVLSEEGRRERAFDEVRFEKDLSSLTMDYNEFIQKQGVSRKSEIKNADEAFNKEAQKQRKLIKKWERLAQKATGERRNEYEYQKERAEKNLALGVATRQNAVLEAFRAGAISEYYFDKRKEQLSIGDFSRAPELFEADALKDGRAYLKDHDMQDLDEKEADSILDMAKKKAERDKKNFYTKKFLMMKGIASEKRYEISEMKIEEQLLYRRFASEREYLRNAAEDGATRISVDVDDLSVETSGDVILREEPDRGIEPPERRADKR